MSGELEDDINPSRRLSNDSGSLQLKRTRVVWGRAEMDKLLTWIEQNKPDLVGHGRRKDCVRIKNEVFARRVDYSPKTIKEKLLNMEKRFKKAHDIKLTGSTAGIDDETMKDKIEKVCPFYDRIERLKRMHPPSSRNLDQSAFPTGDNNTPGSVTSDRSNEGSVPGSASSTAPADSASSIPAANLSVLKDSAGANSFMQFYPLDRSYTGPSQTGREGDGQISPHHTKHWGFSPAARLSLSRRQAEDGSKSQQDISGDLIQTPTESASTQQSLPGSSSSSHYNPHPSQQQQQGLDSTLDFSQQNYAAVSGGGGVTLAGKTSIPPGATNADTIHDRDSISPSVNSGSSQLYAIPRRKIPTRPLDFQTLISVLEQRERRLKSDTKELLELEKRRLDYVEVMENKRLQIEQSRYEVEAERTQKIENVLMALVVQARGVTVANEAVMTLDKVQGSTDRE